MKDHGGHALAYVYLERKSAAGAERPKLLTRDEARRIAANIAKLPERLGERAGQKRYFSALVVATAACGFSDVIPILRVSDSLGIPKSPVK